MLHSVQYYTICSVHSDIHVLLSYVEADSGKWRLFSSICIKYKYNKLYSISDKKYVSYIMLYIIVCCGFFGIYTAYALVVLLVRYNTILEAILSLVLLHKVDGRLCVVLKWQFLSYHTFIIIILYQDDAPTMLNYFADKYL